MLFTKLDLQNIPFKKRHTPRGSQAEGVAWVRPRPDSEI